MPAFDLATLLAKFPWPLLAASMALAVAGVILLTPVARRVGWIDRPDSRKTHEGEVPLIGGWCLLLAMVVLQTLSPGAYVAPVGYWLGALMLFAIALIDDRFPIRARYRFLVQIGAAVAGVSFGGQMLPHLGNLLGTGTVSHWAVVAPITILGTVAVINAVNFTDGADGLCGGIGFISLFWFLIAVAIATSLAWRTGQPEAPFAASLIPLAATLMGALAGFLLFNLRTPWRSRAAVFLGDSGSMLIGFTLAWFAIHVTSAFGAASVPPVVCLWIMAIPLADSASCIVRRVLNGIKPTRPDRKHLHHLLHRFGWSHGQSVLLIHVAAFACGLAGVAGWWLEIPEHWLFAAFLGTLAGFVGWTFVSWRRLDGRVPERAGPQTSGATR